MPQPRQSEEPSSGCPDRNGTHLLGAHVPPNVRHETSKEKVLRPDRVGTVAMTTRVSPKTRRFFKVTSAQLDLNMEEMQRKAFALFMSRFRGKPESEYLTVWEAIIREAAGSA
jgi:hypothetical protein